MAHLVGSYRFTTAGYDAANTRLIDESGLGNHLPLISGTPDFTGSYSSKTAFKMRGTAYFGGPNILHPECHTVIAVLHPNIATGENLRYAWASARVYGLTDPAHESASQPFEDGTSSEAQTYATYHRINENGGRCGNDGFGVDNTSGYSDAAWNVITSVWNGETSQAKHRFGTGAWATAALTQHRQVPMLEEMRLGYRPTALTTTSNDLGCLRIDIYAGDFATENPTEYAARITALVATPEL